MRPRMPSMCRPWSVVRSAFGAVLALCLSACAADEATSAESELARSSDALRLRVVAANLTSGLEQSYDPGHGLRILKALSPDVVLIQEFNFRGNQDVDFRSLVETTFGAPFSYARPQKSSVANGIISRYPIVATGVWDDPETISRDFVWARIDVPGDKDLWAISVHLLTENSATRQAEATSLVQHIKTKVPAGDYLVLGGDFNTQSRGERCIGTLGQVVRSTAPYPADTRGNGNTNRTRNRPYDWVLADRDLDVLARSVDIGGAVFPNGLVFDSRTFAPLSALPPVQASDSGARNMQHMAVVRDFGLPREVPDAGGERDGAPGPEP